MEVVLQCENYVQAEALTVVDFIMLYVVWVLFHRWCHAPVVIIVSRFAHTGSLISSLWTGSLLWDGVKKSRGEGRKRVLSFSSRFFHPFPQTKSLFTGYLISYGLTALVELYSTDNEVACVAGVERGRGRGNLSARESVWGSRGRKERRKGKVSLLPPPSRVVSRPNSLPLPFPFERLPRRLMMGRSSVLLKDGIEQRKKRSGNIFSANSTQKYIEVLDDMVRDYNIGLDKNIWIFSLWDI